LLIIHKNYEFSNKDVGKTVLLQNTSSANIISVIRENGGICVICGRSTVNKDDVFIWNHDGKSDIPGYDIVAMFGEK